MVLARYSITSFITGNPHIQNSRFRNKRNISNALCTHCSRDREYRSLKVYKGRYYKYTNKRWELIESRKEVSKDLFKVICYLEQLKDIELRFHINGCELCPCVVLKNASRTSNSSRLFIICKHFEIFVFYKSKITTNNKFKSYNKTLCFLYKH